MSILDVGSDLIAAWRNHPSRMVRELFMVEPDPWQHNALEAFPSHPRISMQACKGPGKTALETWLGWNFLLTRPHPKCAATSISGANLADNFWSEMAKWRAKAPLLQHLFEWTKSRIFLKASPETWFMSARTWPRDADTSRQADTLAGLHADYILFIIDESGGVPDAVMVSADAALSSCVEGHIIQAGNPTMLSGPLYRASTKERKLWYVIEITGDPDDPNRSPRVSIEWANQMIEKYGRDHPWVKVNVFGKFPPSSLNSLIGPAEVEASMKRYYRDYEIGDAPKILGVDVAREGDDASVIFKRQGIQAYKMLTYRNIDSTQGASIVNREWLEWDADACFLDGTGGFGSGWYDQLILLGKAPVSVHFASQAHMHGRYANKRAEMYFEAVEWIKRGGALPKSTELLEALTNTTYTHQGDRLLLEPKELVKERLGFSPDEADAFVLTFAEPVTPKTQANTRTRRENRSAVNPNYSPYRAPDRSHELS
jgi:phage terminase large subunit